LLNKVEICGVNTSKLPVLSNETMRQLFVRAQAGDRDARGQLISGNLRLVLSVMQRFHNRGENADDLFHVGCIGLIKATDNFDLAQNVKFSTYAVPMIIGEIRRYLRDNSASITSTPIRLICRHGITISSSRANREKKLASPGTTTALICPDCTSTSTSRTKPKRLPSVILMMSLWRKSETRSIAITSKKIYVCAQKKTTSPLKNLANFAK